MINVGVLLTNDYEVFGNGHGDVERNLVVPTRDILSVCANYAACQSLFVDIVEYWRFCEAEDAGTFGNEYCAASLIESQLCEAVAADHDVQLHVHPQWLMATPVRPDAWQVDNRHWRTPMVPKGLGDVSDRLSLRGLLHQGKQTLEELLKPVNPNYQCVAFRAGGYCIQPEGEVLQAMREVGLKIESSVCPGRRRDHAPGYFDFRSAPLDRAYWKISDRVDVVNDDGLLIELPIATERQARVTSGRKRGRQLLSALRRLILPKMANLDYCNLSGAELIAMTERYMKRADWSGDESVPVPIVLIGHSKEWSGPDALEQYLEWVDTQSNIEMMTVAGWWRRYEEAGRP